MVSESSRLTQEQIAPVKVAMIVMQIHATIGINPYDWPFSAIIIPNAKKEMNATEVNTAQEIAKHCSNDGFIAAALLFLI